MLKTVTSLPFNQHVGIRKSTTEEGQLEIPQGLQYLNHIGTVHASAQLALAEACSGEFLLHCFPDTSQFVPLVRRVEAKFKKAAQGRIRAKSNTKSTTIDEARQALATKGRCFVTIQVDVYDEHGEHTLSSNIEWFLARATSQSPQ